MVAADDHSQTVEGEAVQIAFGDNDTYPNGEDLRAFTTVTRSPANGSAELDELDLLLIYVAETGFTGTDEFEYTTCDTDTDACDSATVTVEVQPTAEFPEPPAQERSINQRAGPTLSGPCGQLLAWGGYENGRVPADRLTSVGDRHLLEAGAAEAYLGMREEAKAHGVHLDITDSYRSYDEQVDLQRRKGHLVATAEPGTSVHGWGKAVDLAVPDPVRVWLEDNAAGFGWINPEWAQRPGKSFEPWHWEFVGASGDDCGVALATATTDPPPRRGATLAAAILLPLGGLVVGVGLWWRRRRALNWD